MPEIIQVKNEKKQARAEKLYVALQCCVRDSTKIWFDMGGFLCKLKKDKLYRYVYGLDVSWAEFLGESKLGIKEKSADNMIWCYKYWILECGYKSEDLANHLGIGKAQALVKYCREHPEERDELLEESKELSTSDVINTVREREGRLPMPVQKRVDSLKDGCILCGKHPEKAHFPISKGAGGEFTIPLCRECHSEYHSIGVDTWFRKYRIPLELHLRSLVRSLTRRLK